MTTACLCGNNNSPTKLNDADVKEFSESTCGKIMTCHKTNNKIEAETFKNLIKKIMESQLIKELHIKKSLLTESQIKDLHVLASDKKVLKIIDVEGSKFGSIYTDWNEYNMAKTSVRLEGMAEATSKALEFFNKEYSRLPLFVVDFGCSIGKDSIPLAEKGCQKIWAIDANEEAISILKQSTPPAQQRNISCFNRPFMELEIPSKVELFISNYVWPYRKPEVFPACWKKCVDAVAPGGYIAGNFFGPITGLAPDPGMTFHSEPQVRSLLDPDFNILWFKKEPEGSSFKVFGGKTPSWGDLYHIVAKKKTHKTRET